MKRDFCDRCDVELTENGTARTLTVDDPAPHYLADAPASPVDLCGPCYAAFREWLRALK